MRSTYFFQPSRTGQWKTLATERILAPHLTWRITKNILPKQFRAHKIQIRAHHTRILWPIHDYFVPYIFSPFFLLQYRVIFFHWNNQSKVMIEQCGWVILPLLWKGSCLIEGSCLHHWIFQLVANIAEISNGVNKNTQLSSFPFIVKEAIDQLSPQGLAVTTYRYFTQYRVPCGST